MKFNIVTLFPDFFKSPLSTGLLGKAIENGLVTVKLVDLREFSEDRFRRCDDYPYGGGSGMVLQAPVILKALDSLGDNGYTIYPSPGGTVLDQDLVKRLSAEKEITLICGHYEGIDQRVIDSAVDIEVSVGDYVLSGGEFAALVIIDTVSRYVPGFMSNSESLEDESFEKNLLEYPQYTRPPDVNGLTVPEVLTSGDHGSIEKWRQEKRIEKTRRVRPDLYRKFILNTIRGE